MSTKKSNIIRNISHWTIFILASLTLTMKILEVSAGNSLKLIADQPDCSQYSRLVQTGYLFER